MRNKTRVNKTALKKIISYCNDIENIIDRFGNSLEDFEKDFAFQYSCGMCIIQIGELTTRLTDDFKEKYSEIAWIQIKGLRNIYAHEYENVDFEEIWKIISEDIPDLKEKLQKILSEIE